jgi:hypothetical protein
MSRKLIPNVKVASRYGRHTATVRRWEEDPELNFPKAIRIRGKRYFDESELDAFDERQRDAPAAPDALRAYRESHRP